MSYDLALFDPAVAPKDRAEFLAWFEEQVQWDKGHDFESPGIASPVVHACFLALIEKFPAMNGPFAKEDLPDDEGTLADYFFAPALLYITFAWSKAQEAYETTKQAAEQCRAGFFNVSSNTSDVWLPDSTGSLVLAHTD